MSEALESRLAALEAQVGELRDREAIREVIHRYCQAVDRCDLEMLKSCYHADGYDDHGFFAGNAHEFAEYVIPRLECIDSSMHSIASSPTTLTTGSKPSTFVQACSTVPIKRYGAAAARMTPATFGSTCSNIGPSGLPWTTSGRGSIA